VALAGTLGLRPPVASALADVYERWDGAGEPSRKKGDAIALAARVTSIAFVVEVFLRAGGRAAAVAEVRRRRGRQLDPHLVDAFLGAAPEILAVLAAPSVWEPFLELEPEPWELVAADRLAAVALVFGRFADVKSPFSIGHSPKVAALAERLAHEARLPTEDRERLRIAALLHDVGVVSVPNGILDKPGPFSRAERERMESHAYHTRRILSRTPLLEPYAEIAGSHHERLDGSGYPRARVRSALDVSNRILAVADVACALSAERADRPAHSNAEVSRLLEAEARDGRLDREVVSWALDALGMSPVSSRAAAGPDGLTEREVEVLRHLARGRSNKEIGERLFTSPRAIEQHVRGIHEKTKVSTRAAAALYATTHELM
jgi:putative nucleotidyltransferase with HDIG domain